jgi:NAD-dependent SIR2 family protein deacetylase
MASDTAQRNDLPSAELEEAARRAAHLIEHADALIIGAGAGMGVDSGLPDFRGSEGFWRAYPALGRARIDFESIASPDAFRASASLAWGFYGHRLALYRRTVPHEGFALLRRIGESMRGGSFVYTSNVDGQFQKAGFDPCAIVECHGSLHHLQCLEPCGDDVWCADAFAPDVDEQACVLRNAPPACVRCGTLARPNVLMFGDASWIGVRQHAQQLQLDAWLAAARRPVVVELGAGTAIPSVRHFSQRVVRAYDAAMIRINPREARVHGPRDVSLPIGAAAGMRAIAEALNLAKPR